VNRSERDRERDLTAAILSALEARRPAPCPACGGAVCGHAYVLSVALGYRDAPHCIDCLARGGGRETAPFLRHVRDYLDRRDCYRTGWAWATAREPRCRWAGAAAGTSGMDAPDAKPPPHDAEWDAGDMGCGDLVLELRLRLRAMAPRAVLRVRAADAGAPEDLPAWCGLTGNALVAATHPYYWIRRKEN
jgi:tRNA 2-thiouridine synthesizing protein A